MNQPALATAPHRDDAIDRFLAVSGWDNATRTKIPGDASFRRYERITRGKEMAILMDAPPEREDVKPYITVAEYLVSLGLSAPKIYARDVQNGFLLLEDLGDDLYSRLLAATAEAKRPAKELELYQPAIDVLIQLYQTKPAEEKPIPIPHYDEALYMRELHLLTEWFLPLALPEKSGKDAAQEFSALWMNLLKTLPDLGEMLVLRDHHADNLLWLPKRQENTRVGLLDFQDAVWGSPAYDLVSLLEDARRDVDAATVNHCLRYFAKGTGLDAAQLETAYAILGAQRNTKIIGIFSRLFVRDKKPRYLELLPRVWKHLERDLAHPALHSVKAWYDMHIPKASRSVVKA